MRKTKAGKESHAMSRETTNAGPGPRRAFRAAAAATLAGLAALTILAGPASASQEIAEFTVASSNNQAGAHGDFLARLRLGNAGEPEVAKNLTVNVPTGIFGNPGAIFRCRAADFVLNHCAPGAQVGLITIVANYEGVPNTLLGTAPVYNMETVSEDEAARLEFVAPTVDAPIVIPVGVRSSSDYGLRMTFSTITQSIALSGANLTIWAFPADPEHDPDRFRPGEPGTPPGCPAEQSTGCNQSPFPQAGIVVRPFTDNPSICTGEPLSASLVLTTYQDPTPTEVKADYPATTGCESQKFDPVFNVNLTSSETDQPTGIDIQLKANQFLAGKAPSPSTLKSGILTLPEGLTINPDAADGQIACTDQQAGFGSDSAGQCPDSAKIGTLEVTTPALPGPLIGSLYIGEPRPGDQYRAFMIFDGFGIHAKLLASFQPDPKTGQLTVSVANLPQVPFEAFDLHLFASDRGLLATPTRCSIYTADSSLVPWNNRLAPQHSAPTMNIRSGPHAASCPGQIRPFDPRLQAGTTDPTAGAFSNFILKLDRDDGDQFLGDLNFKMPPGFTGDLRGINYCPESAIADAATNLGRAERASPSCSPSSMVGTTNVAAGPGEHPFHAVGRMYLAGPFKGAPLSLVAITPALAGPYDYGVVVVRVALHIDPETAQVTAVSDTVPSIIGGIPIRMRSIQVNIDRTDGQGMPNFTINPTNCAPFNVESQGIGDQGTITDFSSYFQAVNCTRLPFRPTMTVKQTGSHKGTKRSANPALQFDLRTRPGDANIESLAVTLPSAFEIAQSHLGNICSEKELAATDCAGRQAIGMASTITPLLDQPLSGPVYAVSGGGGLPRLAFLLNGQVQLLPRAEEKTVKGGRLQTIVPTVPDAPIGHFSLTIYGGKHGYLANTRELCVHTPVIGISYTAQNGKKLQQNVKTAIRCGSKSKKQKRHRR
jgi:hypothetical protein